MNNRTGFLAGLGVALAGRALMARLLLEKFRSDVRRLDRGDYSSLLSSYADDAVLHFNEGPHRWAGAHRGKAEIERFLRDFTAAGLQGELLDVWFGGPPWSMTLVARFDDHADDPAGNRIYANRTVLVLRTRWGKIVEHDDFYEDSGRILELEQKLNELGIRASGVPA
ncbi:MAG: hypothetical protein NVSMB51_03820 [Solirubrobacteraceae bacterium]